jgi:hypothetical protein
MLKERGLSHSEYLPGIETRWQTLANHVQPESYNAAKDGEDSR